MFLHVQKSGKYQYVMVRETEYLGNGKRRSRTVENLGRLDRLLAEDPQALEKLKAKYNVPGNKQELKARELVAHAQQQLETPQAVPEVQLFAPLCYSLFPLWRIWNEDLGMSDFLEYLKNRYSKIEFDLGNYVAYLTLKRMVEPQSVLGSFLASQDYLGHWLKECRLDELYRSYTFLADHHEEIMSHVVRRIAKLEPPGPATMVFYDVTNVYFEAPLTDEEKHYLRPMARENLIQLLRQACDSGQLPPEAILPLQARVEQGKDLLSLWPDVLNALPRDLKQRADEILHLRTRGKSKEHRDDLPLVSIALTIDQHGFPLDFAVYPGRSSEFRTMRSSIEQLKRKYHAEDVIVVADRGLNSFDTLKMLLGQDLGFLVAQKVTNLDRDTEKALCDPTGYIEVGTAESDEPHFRYKAISGWQRRGTGGDSVECTLICTFSPEREARDLYELHMDEERARKAVEDKQEMGGHTRSWTRLVEVHGAAPTAYRLNQRAIERRRRLCGYSAVVYAPRPGSQRKLEAGEISKSYHRLRRIEECFRLLWHNLDAQPVGELHEDRIHGHCMACVLALAVWRLLERRLNNQSLHLTPDTVRAALKGAYVTPFRPLGSEQELFYFHNPKADRMKPDPRELLHKAMEIDDLVKFQANQPERHIDEIMRCCGLTPLSAISSRTALCRDLGRRYTSDEEMVGTYYKSALARQTRQPAC